MNFPSPVSARWAVAAAEGPSWEAEAHLPGHIGSVVRAALGCLQGLRSLSTECRPYPPLTWGGLTYLTPGMSEPQPEHAGKEAIMGGGGRGRRRTAGEARDA